MNERNTVVRSEDLVLCCRLVVDCFLYRKILEDRK